MHSFSCKHRAGALWSIQRPFLLLRHICFLFNIWEWALCPVKSPTNINGETPVDKRGYHIKKFSAQFSLFSHACISKFAFPCFCPALETLHYLANRYDEVSKIFLLISVYQEWPQRHLGVSLQHWLLWGCPLLSPPVLDSL